MKKMAKNELHPKSQNAIKNCVLKQNSPDMLNKIIKRKIVHNMLYKKHNHFYIP